MADAASRRRAGPRIVLVTDRRRLVRSVGAPASDWPRLLSEQVRGAISGGVDLIQIREADLGAAALSQFLRQLFQNVPDSAERVVVNDRLDVALVVGAAGVHLPERGLPVDAARALSGRQDWVIGRSIHGADGVDASHGASFLVAGTLQDSPSKPGASVLGWDGLKAVVDRAGAIPVVAIGGLTSGDVPKVLEAGATGVAAISWFVPENLAMPMADFVHSRVAELCLVFDSHAGVSYTRGAGR